jgi:hypothetical protein
MKLAVCTNKTERLALRLLDSLGLTSRFAAITGGDTFAVKKPHGDHILGTIERAGGTAANSVMIGDSINDILAAQNAGVPAIGVPFGYSDKPVETFNPVAVISHFDELQAALIRQLIEAPAPVTRPHRPPSQKPRPARNCRLTPDRRNAYTAFTARPGLSGRGSGRVAQRESTAFTRQGSQVQSLSRPPFYNLANAKSVRTGSSGTHFITLCY